MKFVLIGALALLVVRDQIPNEPAGGTVPLLSFSCRTFPADLSEEDLRSRFGSRVATGLVPWGGAEGDYNEGTVLYGDMADAKVEIFWQDLVNKRRPQWISTRGTRGRWRTPGGIMLGTDLLTIEKLNRRPFRLIGFGSDLQGGVASWAGGHLEAQNSKGCHVGVVLDAEIQSTSGNPVTAVLMRQIEHEREFSSGHPAMQAVNPKVYELVMGYSRTPG